MTSAQTSDEVGSTFEPTSSVPIFKRLYLVIYKILALTFSVQMMLFETELLFHYLPASNIQ